MSVEEKKFLYKLSKKIFENLFGKTIQILV